MKAFAHLILLSSIFAVATQSSIAKRGDMITHTAAQPNLAHTTVKTYRITGWQNQLTAASPNLMNYYWEPMYRRVVNTTNTTLKGAQAAPPVSVSKGGNYIKPNHVDFAVSSNLVPAINASEQHGSARKAPTVSAPPAVYSYKDCDEFASRKSTAAVAHKESVYGIIKGY